MPAKNSPTSICKGFDDKLGKLRGIVKVKLNFISESFNSVAVQNGV
jgi:hypothetical protein